MAAFHNIAALIVCVTPLITAAAEKSIDSNSSVEQGLRSISQELISEWEIVGETNTYVEVASKARLVDTIGGFCVRDVIRLRLDESRQVASLTKQLEYANSSEDRLAFQIFALAQSGEPCPGLAHARFFRASSLGGLRPTDQLLEIVKDLADRDWLQRSSKYVMKYEDQVAQRCLSSNRSLGVRNAIELPAEAGGFSYRVQVGVCSDDKSEFLIEIDLEVALDNKSAHASARSVSKAELDCIAIECLRP